MSNNLWRVDERQKERGLRRTAVLFVLTLAFKTNEKTEEVCQLPFDFCPLHFTSEKFTEICRFYWFYGWRGRGGGRMIESRRFAFKHWNSSHRGSKREWRRSISLRSVIRRVVKRNDLISFLWDLHFTCGRDDVARRRRRSKIRRIAIWIINHRSLSRSLVSRNL